MGLLVLLILLVLLFGGFGFGLHLLWIVAAVLLVVMLLGLVFHGPDGRWYRW